MVVRRRKSVNKIAWLFVSLRRIISMCSVAFTSGETLPNVQVTTEMSNLPLDPDLVRIVLRRRR